ncbi:MAG: biotin--[acetyl-CoA-carboxylase] ligase [Pseudomonadota bacterium]|nr:biotin--[acetyl-CoA-carboxylase] ligase [Pseudomonadota bacterium]MDP1902847.1 biotin--[acetyl-CoA-carboxylase] ligase [Pseudomonadota bacterium]MDP2352839.1 biotin--[acetyl-CoA-carboxylase] ligase [Pseudomonadota bacterium]
MPPQLLDILRQLSHDDFHSGEEVARRLHISRASVHNAVQEAEAFGLRVQAVRGRGYRLAQPISWLNLDAFAPRLNDCGVRCQLVDVLDSTNSHLMQLAHEGEPHKSLVVAEWQAKGRGRRGRTWLAGLGGSLTFSLLWRFNRPASELSGLSLVVGMGLTRVLRDLGLVAAGVKWPNDILVEDAKLAGVLIELVGDMLGPSTAIIGVGVNVLGSDALRGQIDQAVTDLSEHLPVNQLDRNALLGAMVTRLNGDLERFDGAGFAPFRAEWEALHAYQKRHVHVLTGLGEQIGGQLAGVDDGGALLLDTEQGTRRFHSGEVSLRSGS